MPQKYEIEVTPDADATVPDGDGYYICRSLLSGVPNPPTTLSVSMLMDGPFRAGDDPHTKQILDGVSYRLRVSVTDDSERDQLKKLLDPYLEDNQTLTVDDTPLTVSSHTKESQSLQNIWNTASQYVDEQPDVTVEFNTPTCVVHPHSTITEMFPHRRSLFPQLASSWNTTLEQNGTDERFQVALDPFDVGSQVFEKPHASTYHTYSTLTDIKEDEDGSQNPFFRQGYVGTCEYSFRNADNQVVESTLALALFAEYSGIGTDTRHGCGCVDVNIQTRETNND